MSNNNTQPKSRPTPVALNKANTLVIDTIVRPIYPVRYAYANFFEDRLEPAARPPALKAMLHQKSVKETHGYVARLLRPGWIYIKEESGGDYFHIFRYKHLVQPDGSVQEQFHKYMFRNKVNAQKGILPEKIGPYYRGYPFAFVRKEVSEVSIVYCEEPLNNQIIDELNGNADKRADFMQRVNLLGEDDATVDATAKNLSVLVEDYREQQERVMDIQVSSTDPAYEDIAQIGLDVLTTQNSYKMAPYQIANDLQRKTEYGEVARIVALYDPVGIQKDIAEIMTKVTLWQKEYTAAHVYPYTIGLLVQQMKEQANATHNDDLTDILNDGINWEEHGRYWVDQEKANREFDNRIQQFASLYRQFMNSEPLVGQIGSLDTYFKHAFCESRDSDEANDEMQKFCRLVSDLFSGVLASEHGQNAMKAVAQDADNGNTNNAWLAMLGEAFTKLTTTPQQHIDWAYETAITVDNLLQKTAWLLGWSSTGLDYGAQWSDRMTHRGIAAGGEKLVNTIIPKIMNIFGLRVTGKTVVMTPEKLAQTLASALQESMNHPGRKALLTTQMAEGKQAAMQKLFNWGQDLKAETIPRQIELAEIAVDVDKKKHFGRFKFMEADTPGKVVGISLDGGLVGFSAFLNLSTLYSLQSQSAYSNNNPLARGNLLHDSLQLTSAITALTTDIIVLGRTAVTIGKNALVLSEKPLPYLAGALVPKLSGYTRYLKNVVSGKVFARAIAIANFAAAVDSVWNSAISYRQGNTGEAVGHSLVGTGSLVMGVGSLVYAADAATLVLGTAATATAAASATMLAICTGVGLVLVIIGAVTVMYFSKSDFEVLLENCFWGSGKRYLFWPKEDENKGDRPEFEDRMSDSLNIVQDHELQAAYQLELQEFMNYFYMPQLKLEKDSPFFEGPKTYHYTFKLPAFELGLSELYYEVRTQDTGYYYRGAGSMPWKNNTEQTEAFRRALQNAKFTKNNGVTEITMQFTTTENIQLYWYYEPQPGVITPQRYLTKDGLIKKPIMGMIDGRTA